MASNSEDCDALVQARRTIKRRYFQIPSDQRNLLEQDSSWSQRLNGEYGMMNLPSEALQDIKDQAARKHTKQRRPDSRSNAETSPRLASPEESLPSSAVSWPPSPAVTQAARDRSSVQSGMSGQSGLSEQSRQSRPSEHAEEAQTPSPKSRHQPRVRHALLVNNDDPTSSGLHSDGLELELPGFLSQEVQSTPVNKAAQQIAVPPSRKIGATPPSAQVPESTDTAAILTRARPPKKRRTIEEVGWNKSPSSPPSTEQINKTILQPPPHNRNRYYGSTAPGASHDESRWNAHARSKVSSKDMSPACRGPPLLTRPPPAQKPSHYTQQTQPGHWANEGGPSPYEVFKAAYPDYSENCRKFVSACLSLNQLRRERKIPEFLYDDYIRAHSSDYLLYISECDRKNVETILPAIQWYNETAKQIQYRGGVISKDNIVAVLAAHSDEARAVRRSLGDSQSTASESNAEDGDEEVEDALSADEQEEEEQSRFSPELHIKSPGLPPPRAASTPMQGHDTANDRHASNKKRRLSSPQSANRTKRAAASTALRAATRHEATPAVAGRGSTASDKHTTSAPKEPSRVQSVSRRTHGSELSAPVPSSPPPLRNRSDENKVMAATSVVARPQRANKTSAGAPAQHTHQSKSPDLPPHLIQDGAENEDSDDDAYEPAPRAATVPAAQSRLSATIVPAAAAAAAAAATSPPDRFSSVAPTQSRFKPANRGSTGNEVKSASLDTGLAMARADQDHGTVASETNTPRPRKRVDESPAERSRSFRAFLKARQARTPSSTMPSKM